MADAPTPTDVDVELERAYDRDDLADVFRAFATAREDGAPVRIEGDDGSAAVAVPPRVVLELEAERDAAGDHPVAGLAFDLEWDEPDSDSDSVRDDPTVRPASDADDAGFVIGRDVRQPGDRSTDSAMATMPPDAVPGTRESDRGPNAEGESATRSESAAASESDPQDRSSGTVTGRTSRFEIYEDRAAEWRWRLVHWNGNIVADSGEGYASRSNAKRAARSVMRTAPTAAIVNRSDDESE